MMIYKATLLLLALGAGAAGSMVKYKKFRHGQDETALTICSLRIKPRGTPVV
jgi:uncharacterized membrane protein YsdA (DUF1294 family)